MSGHINDGGPAFPVADFDHQTFEVSTVADARRLLSGMSLRAYMATKFMSAQAGAFWAMETHHGWSDEEMARDAVAKADALIAVLGGAQ
jgi:hypothetical protein